MTNLTPRKSVENRPKMMCDYLLRRPFLTHAKSDLHRPQQLIKPWLASGPRLPRSLRTYRTHDGARTSTGHSRTQAHSHSRLAQTEVYRVCRRIAVYRRVSVVQGSVVIDTFEKGELTSEHQSGHFCWVWVQQASLAQINPLVERQGPQAPTTARATDRYF